MTLSREQLAARVALDLHDGEAGAIVADLRELLPGVRPELTPSAVPSSLT